MMGHGKTAAAGSGLPLGTCFLSSAVVSAQTKGSHQRLLESGKEQRAATTTNSNQARREKEEEDTEEGEEAEFIPSRCKKQRMAPTEQQEGLFHLMPSELVVWVFHFLTVKDLAKASETCSRWHLLAQEDTLWRSLFFHARRHNFLECIPCGRTNGDDGGGVMARSLPLSWKERFRDTYSVKRKFWFDSKEMFIRFDRTTFYCKAPNEQEQFITGEVILNIYCDCITTHGLYLVISGEEAFKAMDLDSLTMNATEETNKLVELFVPLSGNTEWSERKNNKHIFFRGTYHYPFKVPVPRKTLNDRRLPQSFNKKIKSSGGFFKVEYVAYGVLLTSFPHSNLVSHRQPLRFKPSAQLANHLRTKVMAKYSTPKVVRLTSNSFNYLFLQKTGNLSFSVELQKQYFFINAEEMQIKVSVDNSQGRFPVQSITVDLIEVLQERNNENCRDCIVRPNSSKVFDAMVAKGEVKQDIELYYEVNDRNAKGGSIFNCLLFQQSFILSVYLNIFGCVDPLCKEALPLSSLCMCASHSI
jgi:hypothetical protein